MLYKKISSLFADIIKKNPQLVPDRRKKVRMAKDYTVSHAIKEEDINAVIEIDERLPPDKNGFVSCNKLGPNNLKKLWEKDRRGFYILRSTSGGRAVGYLAIFGVHTDSMLIPCLICRGRKRHLNLPAAEEIERSIVSRNLWNYDVIDMYIDAIIVEKGATMGAYALINFALNDLALNYPDVNISRIATVAISNRPLTPGIDRDSAEEINNAFDGAKLAKGVGLTFFKPANIGYDEVGGIRYYRTLFLLDFNLLRRLHPFLSPLGWVLSFVLKLYLRMKTGA